MTRAVLGLLTLLVALPAHAGTLDSWADDLTAKVAPALPARADVALLVHPRDASLARLSSTLEGLALARLAASARSVATVTRPEAARAGGYDVLVDVEVALENGDALAAGRIIATERDLWRAAAGADPAGAVAASFISRAHIDGEVRAYLAATLAPAPVLRPRRMTFHTLRGNLDLGAPLLALAAADLDGNGSAELVALTTGEVAVLRVIPDGVATVARARLEGPPPVPRPRTPVGGLVIAAHEIQARSSEHAAGATFTFAAGALTRTGEPKAYPICPAGAAVLVPGLSTLESEGERFLAAGCGAGLNGTVDAAGTLRLRRPGENKAAALVPGVGTAFALADLDGDGAVELVAAGWRPPGTRDTITVYRIASDGSARPVGRPAPAPAVAAIAAADFDGDGVSDVIAAVRAEGDEPRYELWQLD